MKHWKVKVKEKGNENILTPELMGDYDEDYVKKFFGLEEDDVEWYVIEEYKVSD